MVTTNEEDPLVVAIRWKCTYLEEELADRDQRIDALGANIDHFRTQLERIESEFGTEWEAHR